MPHMRASKGVFKKIWTLPYLLQAIRIRGQASWSCKVELVILETGNSKLEIR